MLTILCNKIINKNLILGNTNDDSELTLNISLSIIL